MGSSKKHKEKDREREHKHKHRHRSRDRSRSRERKHHEKSSRSGKVDGSKRRKHDPEEDMATASFIYNDSATSGGGGGAMSENASSGGGNLSLSIEETNKLRAQLGLKPLDVPGSKQQDDEKKEDDDVHAPPVNMSDVKKTEELREKMLQMKEKRRLNLLMGKVKPLTGNDSDNEADSALSWVMKSRKIEEEKKKAEDRAKMLEEMDNEFGIGNLVAEEFNKKKNYGSKDLKGLKVEHSQDRFVAGKTVILTLKDKGILDDEADDTLINVNIIDDETADKNVENKKNKPDYKPYDEADIDEFGMLKPKEILEKYDEEIYGAKKDSFELGGGGKYKAEHERYIQQIITEKQQQKHELKLPPPSLATEFYTTEEMSSFKKVRKKKDRTLRKKTKIKADDLLNDTIKVESFDLRHVKQEENGGVFGSDVKLKLEVSENPTIPGLDFLVPMNIDDSDEDSNDDWPDDDLTGVAIEEDNAALELELALNKARKIKTEKKYIAPEKLAMQTSDQMDTLTASGLTLEFGNSVVLNATSEFCRSLGEIPTYGLAGNRDENDDEMMDYDKDGQRNYKDQDDDEQATGWQSVEIDTRPVDIKSEDKAVLDDEPVVNQGLGAALQLAKKKGYLEQEICKVSSAPRHTVLEAQNYSIEDKRYDDLDEKYRKRDRYSGGITMEFKEKEGYKPDIKLEYVDDGGRLMSQKEAFRSLSHRFHGKGSGKKKTEKRLKKVEEDQLMKSMSSTDTPLNTVHLLQEKQRANQMPYVILSGGKGIAANTIAK